MSGRPRVMSGRSRGSRVRSLARAPSPAHDPSIARGPRGNRTGAAAHILRRLGAGAVGLALVSTVGCVAESDTSSEPGAGDAVTVEDARPTSIAVAVLESPEEGWGFGEPASEAWIAEWDIDVGPDGAGLPPGSGTVEEGAEVYRTQCQACHGETGVEGPNTVLVSPEPPGEFAFGSDPGMRSTIGNYWPYATTIFDYVRRSMPFDRPGSMTDDEVYAVTAWLLWMNGIIAEDEVMDARSLPAVRMPAREHFVPSGDVPLDALP